MIDIRELSSTCDVRMMRDEDAEEILELCLGNPQFYRYCEARAEKEQILNDLHVTPDGIGMEDKYYVGFYREGELIAVMDLIDGYPEKDIAFIGFFMMRKSCQGQGIGTQIIEEVSACLKRIGKKAIRLGIDKGNPQSFHFWKKNGFLVIREVERNGRVVLYAERRIIQEAS